VDRDTTRWREIDREASALPTAELVARLRAEPYDSERFDAARREIHLRGGPEEFAAGEALARSALATERVIGADVLAQLGAGQPTFVEESVARLLAMLSDPDAQVLCATCIALGHRDSEAAVPALVALRAHPSADVRFGVAVGLSRHCEADAVAALITLSRDADRDARDYATFALAELQETDTPEVRAALLERVADADAETRGQALIGLGRRRDVRALPALRRELAGEFVGSWCVEAAEEMGDPSLRAPLRALRARIGAEAEARFGRSFDQAEDALAAASAAPPGNRGS
jgi:HEAT repeat protein